MNPEDASQTTMTTRTRIDDRSQQRSSSAAATEEPENLGVVVLTRAEAADAGDGAHTAGAVLRRLSTAA